MDTTTNDTPKQGSLAKKLFLGSAAIGLVALLGLAWWLGFLTPEPEPVSITEAAATVASESDTDSDSDSDSEAVSETVDDTASDAATDTADATVGESITSIVGEWTVVESDATFIGYRADGTTGEGVGRSPGVSGTLTATEDQITAVNIVGDMTQLESDSTVRDEHLGDEGLETNTYPESTFVLTEPIDISQIPDAGVETTFSAVGELTVKEITQPVTIELQALIVDDMFIVAGSSTIALADFEATISSTTEATMEFSLVFSQ